MISRRTAVAFGILLIASMGAGIFSSVPALEKADYLMRLPSLEGEILRAVFFQAVMAVLYVTIAVITTPLVGVLGRHAARAYLVFRATGAIFLFAGIATLLLFLTLARAISGADSATASYMDVTGALLRHGRDALNHITVILPWTVGTFLLYASFLKSRLIPRWISLWGVAAAVLTMGATLLYMVEAVPLVSVPYFALNAPTALGEIILALHLVIRGFILSPVER